MKTWSKPKVTVIRNPCKTQVSGLEITSRVSMEGGIPFPPICHHAPVTHSHSASWDYTCLQSGFEGSKNPDGRVGTSPGRAASIPLLCMKAAWLRGAAQTFRNYCLAGANDVVYVVIWLLQNFHM